MEENFVNSKTRKRQMVSVACAMCQSKHRACGSERPCHHCVRLGVECVAGEPKKRPTRKRKDKEKVKEEKEKETDTYLSLSLSSPSPLPSPSSSLSSPSYSPVQEEFSSIPNNDSISFVEEILFSNITTDSDSFSLSSFIPTSNFSENESFVFPSTLSSTSSLPLSSSPLPLSSYSSSFSPAFSPSFSSPVLSSSIITSTSKEDHINELQMEIARLKQQINVQSNVDIERPLMVATVATMVFRLPDGLLMDSTRSLHFLLNMGTRKFTNFDEITPAEQLPEMHALRRRIVAEKLPINQMGYKTLVCGNGTIVTYMSCCFMLHFHDHAILQSTIWNTA